MAKYESVIAVYEKWKFFGFLEQKKKFWRMQVALFHTTKA